MPTEHLPSPEASVTPNRNETPQEQFDRVLRGNFPLLPGANYVSHLSGIETITVVPQGDPNASTVNALTVIPFFRGRGGRSLHETFTLRNDGMFIARLPEELERAGVSKEDLLREVLTNVEQLGIAFWVDADFEIFPPGTSEIERAESVPPPTDKRAPPAIDPDRIEFLRTQKSALFGFVNRSAGGFAGYHGLVFDRFVMLEHPQEENAAYLIDFEPLDRATIPVDAAARSTWLKEQPWVDGIRGTRQAARARGAERVCHSGDWKQRMQEEIDRRSS